MRRPGWASYAAAVSFIADTVVGKRPSVPVNDGLENTRSLVALYRALKSGQVEPVT